jgi:hypothetical protein
LQRDIPGISFGKYKFTLFGKLLENGALAHGDALALVAHVAGTASAPLLRWRHLEVVGGGCRTVEGWWNRNKKKIQFYLYFNYF